MKKILLGLCTFAFTFQIAYAQFPTLDPNWTFIRADNTGISGDYHSVVRGDRFGNIWTGGYLPFWSEGALVRFDGTTFTNWGTYSENYLPDDRIYNIVFDNNDRIWVGTQNGLGTSADGINWQHYTSSNSPLLYDKIHGIAIEANNDVWVVTGEWGSILNGGVGYFNGTSWTFYTSSNSNLPTQQLSDIAVDHDNNKWITCNLGLIKFDGLNWILFTSANSGLSPGSPGEIMIDSLNRIWVCNGENIDIFDGTTWTHINNTVWPVADFIATSMYIRGDKMIFAETGGSARIMMFDGTNWTWEWSNYFLVTSYIDMNGNFWVAGNGVVRKFDGLNWTNYTRYNTGLAENFNNDVFVDSKNRKWFANGNGGIQVWDCPKWEAYGPWNGNLFPSPQNLTTVGTSTCEAPNGDIWFTYNGTYGYAVKIPNGDYWDYAAWEIFDITNAHQWFQSPLEVEVTDNMEVFFRTYNGNTFLYEYSTNSWSVFYAGSGLTAAPRCMTPYNGKMYFGNFGGIDIYDNGTWSNINFASAGVNITSVSDIEFDVNNNMWLGTWEGLWKYDGTVWTNWNITNSNIAANNVSAVEIDKQNNIIYAGAHNTYIWPYYGGISYFNGTGNVFSTFLQGSSPISHKQVEDLALDTLGNLWIITQSEGINVHNPNGLLGFECVDRTLQSGTTGISSSTVIFKDFSLNQNYPNPFNPSTTISFTIPKTSYTTLKVYNLLGQEVAILVNSEKEAGSYQVNWNASGLPSGIYLYKLHAGSFTETRKMILMK